MANIVYKELVVDNLFDCCAVLDAVGVEQFMNVMDSKDVRAMTSKKADSQAVGLVVVTKVASIVIKNIPNAKEPICEFLANCLEWDNGTAVTAEEIRTMKIGVFVEILKGFFKQEGIVDFFAEVVKFARTDSEDSSN